MLRLLHRIRHSLLWSGQIRKYILYAMGEIALVVIGILIALQINNWNEERKARKQILSYTQAIHSDLLAEQERLGRLIYELDNKSAVSVTVLDAIEKSEVAVQDSQSFYSNLISLGGNVGIDRTEGIWDELKRTGLLQTFEDQEFVHMLNEYYQKYDRRINNFNRLPLDNLDKFKAISTRLHTSYTIGSQRLDPKYVSYSPERLDAFLSQEGLYELTSSIGIASQLNYEFFIDIRNQAQSIISYLEEHYADILE